MKKLLTFFLLFLLSCGAFASVASDGDRNEAPLPGDGNTLGQTATECDQGRGNDLPRQAGKNVEDPSDDDYEDGGKTRGI